MNIYSKIKNLINKFKDLTTLGLTNIITSGIGGLFWLYMASVLGTEHYGEVSYFIAIGGLGITFSFLGAGNVLTVYLAKGVRIQATVFLLIILTSIVASAIIFLIFNNFAVSIFLVGNVIFGLCNAELLGKKMYRKYAIYLITQKILMVGFSLAFYYLIGPSGVILGIGTSMFIGLPRIYYGFKESKIDFSLLKSRFGFVGNSYIMDISRALNGTLDKLLVAPILGFALLGNYALGLQFYSILGIVPSVIYSYILPHDASGNPNKKLKKIIIIASFGLAILSIIISPLVIPLLFPKFTNAIEVIQIVSLAIIPGTITITYVSKFLGMEKIRIVLFGSLSYLGIQISTILILGKIFGVNGVAASFVLANSSEMIYFLLLDYNSKKKIKSES